MTPEAAIVERCARALFTADPLNHERDWDGLVAIESTIPGRYRQMVLAVIRELAECEPTEEMRKAWAYNHDLEDCGKDWRDMLRALAEAAGRG
jgi:hypothetical protein